MGSLAPGDAIVFHGLVAGTRGICLVISVQPGNSSGLTIYEPWVTVLTQQLRLYGFSAKDQEDVFWSRVSERSCT